MRTQKERAERAEQEIFRLRNTVAELNEDLRAALASKVQDEGNDVANGATYIEEGPAAASPWTEVIDPDTGETFYWNEETEEMKWDL